MSQTEVGATAFVRFQADSTATSFDGHEIIVRYDPAIVELLEVDQGSLMIDACGESPFFVLGRTDNPVTASDVILCGGLAREGPCALVIHDTSGRQVWRRDWRRLPSGRHAVSWQATDRSGRSLPSGVYFRTSRMSPAFVRNKMTLLRRMACMRRLPGIDIQESNIIRRVGW